MKVRPCAPVMFVKLLSFCKRLRLLATLSDCVSIDLLLITEIQMCNMLDFGPHPFDTDRLMISLITSSLLKFSFLKDDVFDSKKASTRFGHFFKLILGCSRVHETFALTSFATDSLTLRLLVLEVFVGNTATPSTIFQIHILTWTL